MSANGAAASMRPVEKSPFSFFRPKMRGNKPAHRRMSCRDLGEGDCEGWLMKKIHGRLRDKWTKYWFVLKNRNLYYYKDPSDDSYIGRFNLAGFAVSPADSERTNKFAFRVYHSCHGTYFMASDRQEDMVKWMNRLAIATIDMYNNNDDDEIGCHSGGEDDPEEVGTPIESSSDNDAALQQNGPQPTSSTKGLTPSQNDDALTLVFKNFRCSQIDFLDPIGGCRASLHQRLTPEVSSSSAAAAESTFGSSQCSRLDDRRRYLQALRRTLKDKESQLAAIDELLRQIPITSSKLDGFIQQIPTVFDTATGRSDAVSSERLIE